MILTKNNSNRLKDIKSIVSGMLHNNDFKRIKTNIPVLDKQHKILIGIVKNILTILKAPEINKKELGSCLCKLIVYATEHFACEEKLMKSWNYPDFVKHKNKHDRFNQKLKIFVKEIKDVTNLLDVALRLEEWLLVWIFAELLNDDLKMVNSLKKRRRTMWFYSITTVISTSIFIIFPITISLIFIVIFLLLLPKILTLLNIQSAFSISLQKSIGVKYY